MVFVGKKSVYMNTSEKETYVDTRAISFPLVRTTTHGQSVYPDIAIHISNYYISIFWGIFAAWLDIHVFSEGFSTARLDIHVFSEGFLLLDLIYMYFLRVFRCYRLDIHVFSERFFVARLDIPMYFLRVFLLLDLIYLVDVFSEGFFTANV